MSLTTPSGPSAVRFQSILNSALQDYTKQTRVDLSKYDFVSQLERCGSPDEVLWLLRDKAKKFKEYRDGNRKLINWITPVVQVIHVFAGFLGEVTSMVSRKAFDPFASNGRYDV
jgi:STAND-like protein